MNIKEFFTKLSGKLKGRIQLDVGLASYTTFRCIATADVVYVPRNRDDLAFVVGELQRSGFFHRKDWLVLGRGSNVLISDQGYHGCIFDLTVDFCQMDILRTNPDSILIKAEAGLSNGTLLQFLRGRGWSGFEFAFGIPGSIGGGIRMNAGTKAGWFGDVLEEVELMDLSGRISPLRVSPAMFQYRDFPLGKDNIVLSGTFQFQKAPSFVIQERITYAKNQRKNQPLEYPNIGSVFRNPPENHAGRLIEEAGLKGLRMGDAEISQKHANFIINLGNAKTRDVLSLIDRIKSEVLSKSGILLEEEVHCIGEC